MEFRLLRHIYRFIMSLYWDLRYFLEFGIKNRVQHSNYQLYVVAKLYPNYMKQGNAASFIVDVAASHCVGAGIDVGAGKWPVFGARAVEDNETENAYKIAEKDGALDYVFSSHLLEHLERPVEALKEWSRVVRPGGVIFLYVPHPVCEMWDKEILDFHIWNPSPHDLSLLVHSCDELEIVEQSKRPDSYMSQYIIARKKMVSSESLGL